MNFINHGITGAAIYMLLFYQRAPVWVCALLGFFLGSIGDTLDWAFAKLGWSTRYGPIYNWFHHTAGGFMFALITLAPLPHYISDKFVHSPIMPDHPNSVMDEVVVHTPMNLTRRQIFWLLGELTLLFLNFFLLYAGLTLWI